MTFLIVLCGLSLLALWRIAAHLGHLHKTIASISQVLERMHSSAGAVSGEIASVHAMLRISLEDIAGIRELLSQLVPKQRAVASESSPTRQKADWEIENEWRDEMKELTEDLVPEKLVSFLGQRYQLPKDDPWILQMLQIRVKVGLQPMITALRKREKA